MENVMTALKVPATNSLDKEVFNSKVGHKQIEVSDMTLTVSAMSHISENDLPAVKSLADKIDIANPLSIAEFGREVAEHTSRYADSLLDQVHAKDLDKTGSQLTEVVVTAKRINLQGLSDRRSKIPLIGPIIDRFKITKDKIVTQFQTTKGQIDSLMTEIDTTCNSLTQRIHSMGEMFDAVTEEYRLLALHIAAGKMKLEELRGRSAELRKGKTGDLHAQEISDLERTMSNLDKRVGDLQVIQHSALQSLPMIRIIQSNNVVLVEKFHTIKELTIPAWKRQFLLALSLNEQKNAVQLTESIDDATNDFLRRNADLLHQNAVSTAKSNQRLVIDVETLEKVHSTLIETVQDVIRIQRQGVQQRRDAESKLLVMRNDLQKRLSSQSMPSQTGARAA